MRPRSFEIGLRIGVLDRGPLDAITDVPGVKVGHTTIVKGDSIRTGVTVVMPPGDNPFERKLPAAVHVINGFGKSVGLIQVEELGVIESPIALTNTLSVWRVADGMVDWLSKLNPGVRSFNPVVGECNDGFLNDILARSITAEHLFQAIDNAKGGEIEEGNVGAGTGMSGFGWKAGIGTASRVVQISGERFTLGALVVTNTGSAPDLIMAGVRVGEVLRPGRIEEERSEGGGSIMIVIATDAPLDYRRLKRVAKRGTFGLARAGAMAFHGSGDFVIAFSTRLDRPPIPDEHISPLFRATVESVEEAILNSILKAETMTGRDGNIRLGIPIDRLIEILTDFRR
ncbi:TPA: S58 family peptidase [Candidatus Poribacteria bacterium]|nr:S58 family peptidase [Candidatus Poribacteria bacterium]